MTRLQSRVLQQSVINSALEFRAEQESKLSNDSKLTIGDVTTINLTKVEGGVQLNVIPAEFNACELSTAY